MRAAAAEMTVPELGPLLGRLAAGPVELPAALARLEPVRLELLTSLFQQGALARKALAGGDLAATRAALSSARWLALWEAAVEGVFLHIVAEIEQRVRDAATVSRYPARRLKAAFPDPEERSLLQGRLSAAGIQFEEALSLLDDPARSWEEALRRVGGELEAAWERLTETVLREIAVWDRRADSVREWRRPWLPLGLAGSVALLIAGWLGLVLGGYLPLPGWLRPFAEWVWSR